MAYNHLNFEACHQIELERKKESFQKDIPASLEHSPSTLSQELPRNTVQRGYRYIQANKKAIKRHIIKVSAGLFAIASLTGCIPYPVHKTLQLSSEVKVIDSNETPIEGAEVLLISSSYPYGFEKTREIKRTNMEGKAVFESKKEWRVEAIMLHGAEIFFWNWCVYKQGFETILTTNFSSNEFENKPTFVMKRGKSTACPSPPSSQ